MLAPSLDAVTFLLVAPLGAISLLGFAVSLLAAVLGLWAIVGAYYFGGTVPGWAATVLPIYFPGGVQLQGIGVIGKYVEQMYLETKGRPRYFIEEIRRSDEGSGQ